MQESSKDSITLLTDDREKIVEELARHLGLVRVGWIFTDLVADDIQKGTVKHVRNIESHFLSAQGVTLVPFSSAISGILTLKI